LGDKFADVLSSTGYSISMRKDEQNRGGEPRPEEAKTIGEIVASLPVGVVMTGVGLVRLHAASRSRPKR
jgi:hypothetical protein